MSNAWQFKPGNPEYEKYIHSSHWRHTADKRLEVDGHICCVCGGKAKAKLITRKPIEANTRELEENRRSRSAHLRVLEKI